MPAKTIPPPPEGYELVKLTPGDCAPEGCLVFASEDKGWERNYWITKNDWFYAAKKDEEAYDTSRFQRDNVVRPGDTFLDVPTVTNGPTPPPTHVLYTGPKQWQKLPEGSLFWTADRGWYGQSDIPVTAVPGDKNHYAIPLNVSLPAPTTPVSEPDILEEARDLIQGDRASSYGDAEASFTRIAALWSTYKGVEITAKDVASMMILLKVSRGVTSAKRDNWLDIIGYAALGSEIEKSE